MESAIHQLIRIAEDAAPVVLAPLLGSTALSRRMQGAVQRRVAAVRVRREWERAWRQVGGRANTVPHARDVLAGLSEDEGEAVVALRGHLALMLRARAAELARRERIAARVRHARIFEAVAGPVMVLGFVIACVVEVVGGDYVYAVASAGASGMMVHESRKAIRRLIRGQAAGDRLMRAGTAIGERL